MSVLLVTSATRLPFLASFALSFVSGFFPSCIDAVTFFYESFINLFMQSFIDSVNQPVSLAGIHSLVCLFALWCFVGSFVYGCLHSSICIYPFVLIPFLDWFIHSCTQCFTQLVAQSFIHSLNSFVPSFV